MDQQTFERLSTDVSKHFASPKALLAEDDLTREQKLALLRQWEYDLHLMQVATEENMTSDAPPGNNAEKIREVRAAAEKLGADTESDGSAAAKSGSVVSETPPKKAKAQLIRGWRRGLTRPGHRRRHRISRRMHWRIAGRRWCRRDRRRCRVRCGWFGRGRIARNPI